MSIKGSRLPHIKQRELDFKAGVAFTCEKHGVHHKWYMNKRDSGIICSYCLKEKFKLSPIKHMLINAKNKSKERNYEYNLCENDIVGLLIKQNNKCALSNIPFVNEINDKFKMSLDRIDSNKGYTKDNVQLVCIVVNRMKSDLEQDYFINICKKIGGIE